MTPLERVQRVIKEVSGVKSLYGISDWAWGFLLSMQKLAPETLTVLQEKVLTELEEKVFGGAEA